MSTPTEADWKRMHSLVEEFFKKQECEPFRDPVPWKDFGLHDYPAIIKHAMDLGTVKKKIKAKEYTTLYKCAEDVRLVWSNCMTYNADGSDFFKLAEGLQKKWDIQFNKVLTDIGVFVPPAGAAAGAPPSAAGAAGGGTGSMGGALGASDTINNNNKVSLQEKRNMAKLLYQITKEDLGKVLVELEQKCPASLKRNATEDEIELNVDVIPATVMQELKVFTQSLKNINPKKKQPSTKAKKPKSLTTES